MTNSVMPKPQLALTVAQAVALTMLRDGFRQRQITFRTGIEPTDLYRLAALHGITAPHGTVEGHDCHEARDEDPCTLCTRAHGREHAREYAQRRRTVAALPRALRPRGRKIRGAVR